MKLYSYLHVIPSQIQYWILRICILYCKSQWLFLNSPKKVLRLLKLQFSNRFFFLYYSIKKYLQTWILFCFWVLFSIEPDDTIVIQRTDSIQFNCRFYFCKCLLEMIFQLGYKKASEINIYVFDQHVFEYFFQMKRFFGFFRW